MALSQVTPPPICSPPGHARRASSAVALDASSAPSMMTCPPVSPSRWYSWEYQDEGLSLTKFVRSSASPLRAQARQGAAFGAELSAGLTSQAAAASAAADEEHYTYPLLSGRSLSVEPTICLTLPCADVRRWHSRMSSTADGCTDGCITEPHTSVGLMYCLPCGCQCTA